MIIEIIVGFVLGLIYIKVDDRVEYDNLIKMGIVIGSLVIVYLLGIFGIMFMISFVFGLFVYKNVLEDRW